MGSVFYSDVEASGHSMLRIKCGTQHHGQHDPPSQLQPSRLVVAQLDCRIARAVKHDHVSCAHASRLKRPREFHPLTRVKRALYVKVCEKDNVADFSANLTSALGILPQNHRACFP